MRTFVAKLETQVQQKGTYKIPAEMDETYIILKTNWTIWDVRATPAHIIEKLKIHWHLENLQQEYQNKPKTK